MKQILSLTLVILVAGKVALATTQVKCDTGEVQQSSPRDDAPSSSPLRVAAPTSIPYTQDLQTHNKSYIFSIPDDSFENIKFSTADGAITFIYSPSVAKWGPTSQLDGSAPNGVTVIGGNDTSLSAKISLTVGLRSAFVYCNQVK